MLYTTVVLATKSHSGEKIKNITVSNTSIKKTRWRGGGRPLVFYCGLLKFPSKLFHGSTEFSVSVSVTCGGD